MEILQRNVNDENFWPANNFVDMPYKLEPRNEVYQILKRLPKGALLHTHYEATQDAQTFIELAFSMKFCSICTKGEQHWKLTFLPQSKLSE